MRCNRSAERVPDFPKRPLVPAAIAVRRRSAERRQAPSRTHLHSPSNRTRSAAGIFTALTGMLLAAVRTVIADPSAWRTSELPLDFEMAGTIQALATYTNNTLLVGGNFHRIEEAPRAGCALLDEHGILVPSFVPELGPGTTVESMAVLGDGRILLAGELVVPTPSTRSHVAILMASGDFDRTFIPDLALSSLGTSRVLASAAGDLWMAGYDWSRSALTVFKFDPDGRIDPSFFSANSCSARSTIPTLAVGFSRDGRIYLGGNFERFAGTQKNYLCRIRRDGTPDRTFDFDQGPDNVVTSLATDTGDRLVIGGYFHSFNRSPRPGIARLDSDGTLDLSFRPDRRLLGWASALLQLADGSLVVGGRYWTNQPGESFSVIKVAVDGTLIPGFGLRLLESAPLGDGIRVLTQTDRGVVWAGAATALAGRGKTLVQVPDSPGAVTDLPPTIVQPGNVKRIQPLPDGRILASGLFEFVNRQPISGATRLQLDGSVDPTFSPPPQLYFGLAATLPLPDGTLLVGGLGDDLSRSPQLTKLKSTGAEDPDFHQPDLGGGAVRVLQQDSKGEILVGGEFYPFIPGAIPGFVRLQTNGDVSPRSYSPDLHLNSVFAIAPLPDGGVYCGGNFEVQTALGPARHLTRLTADGLVDPGFQLSDGEGASTLDSIVTSLAFDSRGRLIVGGWFEAIGSRPVPGVLALLPNGRADPNFRADFQGYDVEEIAVDSEDRIIARGEFLGTDLTWRSLIRILPNGVRDPSFPVLSSWVTSIMVLGNDVYAGATGPDGSGTLSTRISRIYQPSLAPSLRWSWNPQLRQLTLAFPEAIDPSDWLEATERFDVWNPWSTNGQNKQVTLSLPTGAAPAAFFRGRSR